MVRADDLGYSRAVNYGIYDTVKANSIKNIGLMVNMDATIHGYNLVKDLDICLGQHTNVCVGKPCADPKDIPSLVDENGLFKSSSIYNTATSDFVNLDEAIIEVEAQYQRFKEITHKEPTYFEAHAVMSENLNKAIIIVGNRHNQKIIEPVFEDKPTYINGQPMYMHMDSLFENYTPFDSFKKMVNEKRDGFHMMILHPGYIDKDLVNNSSWTTVRIEETEMLLSNEFKNYIQEKHIKLYTYDEV